ncbi:MAG: SDR family oxidoreductase [Leeuwenhoekiella sp.]
MSTIAIAGLGWLGLPLAQRLHQKGYKVKGSSTTLDKVKKLSDAGLETYELIFTETEIKGPIENFLAYAEILIILIPPGLRKNSGHDHVKKMRHLLEAISQSGIKKCILVSSTGVYGDDQGKVDETDYPKPETNAGRQLLEVEKLFATSTAIDTTIVRFGGLFGGNRNPVKFLAGRKDLNGGSAPVNLIHRDDCLGILEAILAQDAFGNLFNAVHPDHPKKSEYYTVKAKSLGLEPPQYADDAGEMYKEVNSVRVKEILGYAFKVGL